MNLFGRRLVLLATPRQIGVLDWRPGSMHWLGEFSAGREGLTAFRQVVAAHRQLPVLLVVDTVDEDYRSEILPHVQGQARAEMLARKLRQVFRNARFTAAWRQGREATGRRDDRYLLAALTDADWLTPWLSVLQHEAAPLAGITPLAMACQPLLARLRVQEPHVLLAYRLNGRLRLSYYHEGQLRFSRLIGSDTPTQTPGNAADEIAKTQLYLTGQRILPREARLHVLLLDPSGQLDIAQAALNADPGFSARLVDLSSVARALRIPPGFLSATPDIAPLAAIAGAPLLLDLAPPPLLRRHAEFRWRRGLNLAAAVAAAAGLILTASHWLHARDLRDEALRMQADAQRADARHAETVRTFPALAIRPDQLGQVLALAGRLDRAPLDVATLLAPLGQTLAWHPEVVVSGLTLQEASADAVDLRLDARLAAFDGNYRAAMLQIDNLAARLATTPGITSVERIVSPVDTAPGATLTGRTSGETPAEATRFSLSMQVRRS